MHFSANRQNHDFQIAYFIVGGCHTADAAYGILCDLRDNRNDAIKSFAASKKREQAKIIRANRLISSGDEADILEGEADLIEIEAMADTVAKNLAAAIAEMATIDEYMARLEPLRIYSHLTLPQAHEAVQREEWKLELVHRAENSLMTTGSISPDQFVTMRSHPDFKTFILPAIDHIQLLQHKLRLESTSNEERLAISNELVGITTAPTFELPKLLAA